MSKSKPVDNDGCLAQGPTANFVQYSVLGADRWVVVAALSSMHSQIPFDSSAKVARLASQWLEGREVVEGDSAEEIRILVVAVVAVGPYSGLI